MRGLTSYTSEVVHPRLKALIDRARMLVAPSPPAAAFVYPTDVLAITAAQQLSEIGVARPILVGPRGLIEQAVIEASASVADYEIIHVPGGPRDSARRSMELARERKVIAIMKGALHTDELMSVFVDRIENMRTGARISHLFIFDLPHYHKLLGLTDCVINIAPTVDIKRQIITNAVGILRGIGIARPKVGILAPVETINPAIQATIDARDLVAMAASGIWLNAEVEGPFGFDNAISANAAQIKGINSKISGDADLLLVPDLNSGNLLYKSFTYFGGGDCAGLVLGGRVPVIITSRADSALSRVASMALAVLTEKSGSDFIV